MDFQIWYKTLPPVTRTFMTTVLVTTALVSFSLLNYAYLYLDFGLTFKSLQVIAIMKVQITNPHSFGG